MQSNFTVKTLTKDHSDQALALVACEFSAGSPLHRCMKISQQEYLEYLSQDWESYAFNGPINALGAFCNSSDELVGCLIATRFPVDFNNIDTLPAKHQAIATLLQALENQYSQQPVICQSSLLVDLAVVKHSHRGSGIYQQLRTTLHKIAASSGYTTVFGELSSSATQHVCVDKLQHQVVAEIYYKDFFYDGKRPFAAITDPGSIQLVSTSV